MVETLQHTKNNVFLLTAVFGKYPFDVQSPVQWQDNEVPRHATSYARQLNADLQALRPFLEGSPNHGCNINNFFDPTSAHSPELAYFDLATMRIESLTNVWRPLAQNAVDGNQTPELDTSLREYQRPVNGCN